MSEWKARRFWTSAEVVPTGDGYGVALDGRPVRTPAKAELRLPSRGLAEAVAAEWEAQEDVIDPTVMHVTRAANAALDKVAPQRAEVVAMLAEYGDTDLVCYRADAPEGLVERQTTAWDPLLDWAEERFGARLISVQGVMHAAQPPAALDRLAAPLQEMSVFELTAMHDLVSLSGSLVIGLAAAEGAWPAGTLWEHSRIDERWQQEFWGVDSEAEAMAEERRRAFLRARRFLEMLGAGH